MPAPDYAAEIASLETAAASGELTVRDADGSMATYQSMLDLERRLTYFRNQAAASAVTAIGAAPGAITVASFCRD